MVTNKNHNSPSLVHNKILMVTNKNKNSLSLVHNKN